MQIGDRVNLPMNKKLNTERKKYINTIKKLHVFNKFLLIFNQCTSL